MEDTLAFYTKHVFSRADPKVTLEKLLTTVLLLLPRTIVVRLYRREIIGNIVTLNVHGRVSSSRCLAHHPGCPVRSTMNELNIAGLKEMAYRQIVSQIVDADNN